MPFPQLIIVWVVVVVGMMFSAVYRGEKLTATVIGLAILVSTVLTGLAALYPLTTPPSPLSAVVSWARNFLIYAILVSLLTKTPIKRCVISGLIFATLLALLDILG